MKKRELTNVAAFTVNTIEKVAVFNEEVIDSMASWIKLAYVDIPAVALEFAVLAVDRPFEVVRDWYIESTSEKAMEATMKRMI